MATFAGDAGNNALPPAGEDVSGDDEFFGLGGNDTVDAGLGNDSLDGGEGNDLLRGDLGDDTMRGGLGNDTYRVDDAGDVVIEKANEGIDTINTTISLALIANVENLRLIGTDDIDGIGTAAANVITGNAGDNVLNGSGGLDTLIGGLGDDSYVIDNPGDKVTETTGQGLDTIRSFVSLTLAANVENLILVGAGPASGAGNELANVLTGNAGINTLTGLSGNDTIDAGLGDDSLAGGEGNDLLRGDLGDDTMRGGLGNDTYRIDEMSDVVIEKANEGIDTINTMISLALIANVENLRLIGTADIDGVGTTRANVMTGNDGDNVLNGGAGADTMVGELGDDTYLVDDAGDRVKEAAGGGSDTVQSFITTTLASNVEGLKLIGAGNIDGAGNDGDNLIAGNSGANILRGSGGDDIIGASGGRDRLEGDAGDDTLSGGESEGFDTLAGGLGDDVFVIAQAGDQVSELADQGTDTIDSTISLTLAANVERLLLGGSGNINGAGNALANAIVGNSGDNQLDGKTGADTLIGGLGNDVYLVDDAGDEIEELDSEGVDTIRSTISRVLDGGVENLALIGAGSLSGTGNGLANSLTGNGSANLLQGNDGNDSIGGSFGDDTLDGGAGDDTLAGGIGHDVYLVDSVGDVVRELAGQGADTVHSTISAVLGADVESLMITGAGNLNGQGNGLANRLVGNDFANSLLGLGGDDTIEAGAGNDVLSGGGGADRLIGALGDDIYDVDDAGDIVTEDANAGADTLRSSVSITIAANIERLELLAGAGTGTGNNQANTIVGISGANRLEGLGGNDTLEGGGGADSLIGGLGDDLFFVRHAGAVVTEAEGEGTDAVRSSVSFTLGPNVETLELGGGALAGIGNDLNNSIRGNPLSNTLEGGAGNDVLLGGGGNDSMAGGDGSDLIANGHGNDTLDGGAGFDQLSPGYGDDLYIVDGEPVSEYEDDWEYKGYDTVRSSVSYTLGDSIERLELLGTAVSGTGNDRNNAIIGNGLDNILEGRNGFDTLDGGAGNDSLGGGVGDRLNGGAGDDVLTGRVGTQILDGGAGNDSLDGGSEGDIFVFSTALDAAANVDTIVRYSAAADTIRLAQSVFTVLAAGTLAADAFVIGAAAADASDRIVYDDATGAVLYDEDGTGASAAVQFATLGAGLPLTNADFVIV